MCRFILIHWSGAWVDYENLDSFPSDPHGKQAMTITIGSNEAANQLRSDLASTASAGVGDALIGVKQPFTGAVATTQHNQNARMVSVFDFMTAAQVADVQACKAISNLSAALDCTAAIQAAIDWATYHTTLNGDGIGSVYMPGGCYKITDTLQLGYGDSFKSVHLVGEGRRYRGAAQFSGTAIFPSFNDRPALAVSGGRRTSITKLSLIGLNYKWVTDNGLGGYAAPVIDDLVAANWVDSTFPASASSRYAPYCAIAIDPYAGTAPATAYPNVTYPAWTGISTQYGKAYSSDIMIEDVEIVGFVVGVAVQPCDADGNGDFVKFMNGAIECCQYAISVGNTQSRTVRVSNGNFSQCFTTFVTGVNGKQNGKPQALFDSCSFGGIYILNAPNTAYGAGLRFIGCYAESIHAIGFANIAGAAGNCPIGFDGCDFQFDWTHRGVPVSVFNYSGSGGVAFRDCAFSASNSPNLFCFLGDSAQFVFENCQVQAGNAATLYSQKHAMNATCGVVVGNPSGIGTNFTAFSVRLLNYWNLNTGANVGPKNIGPTVIGGTRKTGFHAYANRVSAFPNSGDPGFSFTSGTVGFGMSGAGVISQTAATVTVDMTGAASNVSQFIQSGGDVGDVIFDTASNTFFIVKARTAFSLTLVAQNNMTVAGNINATIGKTGVFYALNCRRYTPYYVTLGDFTSGNATVANFQNPQGTYSYINDADNGLQVDDYMWVGSGADFYPTSATGGKVNSFSTNNVVFDTTMNYTQARVRQTVFVRAAPANNT